MPSLAPSGSIDLISLQSEVALYSGIQDAQHAWSCFGYVVSGAAAAAAFIFLITVGARVVVMLYNRMMTKQSGKSEEDEASLIEKH